MLSFSPAASDSHGLFAATSSGRHCRKARTGCGDAMPRTTTTRCSLVNAGTLVAVSMPRSHPMTPTAVSPVQVCCATRMPGTSPIVVRLRATLNSCTSLFAKAVSNLTTVQESPGGIGKYQFWNFGSARSGGTSALPILSSRRALPSAARSRTVMNQSSTNAFGFEKKIAVFVVSGRTKSGLTSYVIACTSGLLTTAVPCAGVGVARYSGASTLQPQTTAASRALVRTRRIRSSLVPCRESFGGYGVANFAFKTAFTAIAESTDPNTPGLSVYSSSTAAIAIDGASNEAKPMNHASTLPAAGDSAVPLFPAVLVEYVRKTEDTVPSRSVVTACMPSRMSERAVGIESTEPACVFG